MNVMVMDVEGTDGRERGEDQVRIPFFPVNESYNQLPSHRTSSASPLFSHWPPLKFSL